MRIRKRSVPLPLSLLSPVSIPTATDPTTSALLSSAVQLPPRLPPSTTSPAPQPNPNPKPWLLAIDLNQPCRYSTDLDEPYIDINHHHRPLQLEEENEKEEMSDLRLHHDDGAAADSKVPSSSSSPPPPPSMPAEVEAPPPRQDDDDDNNKDDVGTDDNDDGDNKDGKWMLEARCEVEDRCEPKEEVHKNNNKVSYKSRGTNNTSKDNMVSAKSDYSCRDGPAQPRPPPAGSSTHHDNVNPDHKITSGDHLPEPVVASPTMHRERWWPNVDKAIPLKKRRSSFDINGEEVTMQGMITMKSITNEKSPFLSFKSTAHDNGREEDNNTTNLMWVDIDANGDYNTNDGGNDHQSCTVTSNHKLSASTTAIKVCNNTTAKKTSRRSKNVINTTTIATNSNTDDGPSGGCGANRRKKGKRSTGAVIMQGSRCSRVNGRGWRCCQPTLVGYSLCDHHLGKAKLRSMSTGRSCGATSSSNLTTTAATTTSLSSSTLLLSPLDRNSRKLLSSPPDDNKKMKKKQQPQGPSRKKKNGAVAGVLSDNVDDGDDDDNDEEDGGSNKRMKLGVVKARSLSSLLGQPNTMVVSSGAMF